jgi:hypothetical protein
LNWRGIALLCAPMHITAPESIRFGSRIARIRLENATVLLSFDIANATKVVFFVHWL